jgi:4-hydroxy-tetrahydrodipicolinate synthase
VEKVPVIAGLKALLAHHGGDPAWRTVRPPLSPLASGLAMALVAELDALGFSMPGLRDPARVS